MKWYINSAQLLLRHIKIRVTVISNPDTSVRLQNCEERKEQEATDTTEHEEHQHLKLTHVMIIILYSPKTYSAAYQLNNRTLPHFFAAQAIRVAAAAVVVVVAVVVVITTTDFPRTFISATPDWLLSNIPLQHRRAHTYNSGAFI